MRIGITYVCSYFVDVQEANRSFSQKCRVWNCFARRRFTYGWITSFSIWWMCLGNNFWASHTRKSHSVSLTFWQSCFWVNWPRTTQNSQQFTLNPTLPIRRQCGSDPNDHQRTKPKFEARHANAPSWFRLVILREWTWIILFWKSTCDKQIHGRTFWLRECSPQCSRIHCWLCGKSDDLHESDDVCSFLANFSLAQLQESPRRCLRRWHSPRTLTRHGVNTHQMYWNQFALWMFIWFENNWAVKCFSVLKTRLILLQGCSISRSWYFISNHEKSKCLWDNLSFFDEGLSKVHDAEVHVFSDCVLCKGKGAMNEPEVKFTKRWTGYLEQYKELARKSKDKKLSSYSTYFLGRKTNEIVNEIGESIRRSQKKKMNYIFSRKLCLFLFMWMKNKFPISSKEPKGGDALFLHDAERNAACFARLKPGYFMYIRPGSEKTWNFWEVPDARKGERDELAKQVTDVCLVQMHPILQRCTNFQKGELKKGGANMHFNADDLLVKMMMDLNSSANDFCIVFFGICDYLGKITETNLESQRHSASLFLLKESQRMSLSLDFPPYATENFSSCALIAEGNLLARASLWDNNWHAHSGRSTAEGHLLLLPNQQTRNSCRKSERKYWRRTLSTVKLQITQKSRGSGNSFTQGLHETALDCSACFAKKLADQPVLKVDN